MKQLKTAVCHFYQNMNKSAKVAFLAVWISSLLAHGFMYFNKFSYHDDIGEMFRLGGTYNFGRWFLGVIAKIWSEMIGNVSLPLWNGMVSTFFIALSAMLIVNILDIRSTTKAVLLGTSMMVFPVVISTYAFMFTAPHYFFALFLGVLAVWLQEQGLMGTLLAMISITFSLGIYQAYLAVPMCLFLLLIVIKCNQEELTSLDIIKSAGRYLLVIGVGLISYFIANEIFLKILHLEMTTSQGLSDGYQWNLQQIVSAVLNTYRNFFTVEYEGMHPSLWMKVAVWIGFVADVLLMGLLLARKQESTIKHKKSNKKKSHVIWKKLIMAGMFLLFPFVTNAIYMMANNENTHLHLIMRYSLVFIWILPLVLLEQCERIERGSISEKRLKNSAFGFFNYLLVLLIGVQMLLYIYLDNTAYLKAFFVQEQATAYFNRLVTKIETTPGYRDEYPVVYIGAREKVSSTMTDIEELDSMTLTGFDGELINMVNDYTWEIYVAKYCGYEPDEVLQPESVADWSEIDSMPCYPDEGSVAVIRDTVVVKFAQQAE